MSLLTNTNSLLSNIYYFLWLKKDIGLKQSSFQVRIPDTIIMKGSSLLNWYFTSKKTGTILMRKDFQLTKDKVFERFTRKVSKSGIVAYYAYQRNEKRDAIKDAWIKPSEDDELVIEYFTVETFRKFLDEEDDNKNEDSKRPPNGILQKFIDPFGDNQTVIQAIWSPSICVFSKRQNVRYLYDKRWDPYERLVTFDGAEVYSRTVPLRGKQVSQQMRQFCTNIVERVAHVSFENYKIERMVLYFKPDQDNNIHFLYCSGLRLENERLDETKINPKKMHHTPLLMEGSQFRRPHNVKQISTTNTMRPAKLINEMKCLNCNDLIQKTDLVNVDYKFIIQTLNDQLVNQYKTNIEVFEPREEKYTYDRNKLEKQFVKGSNVEVPEFIKNLYPKMTIEKYLEMSKHKHFLSKQIQLCQNCYEKFVSKELISGVDQKGVFSLKFAKMGMAKKKPLFDRQIKMIVAEKNKELAEYNYSKYQNPETYENMLQKLTDEMENKQKQDDEKIKREQNLKNFYEKKAFTPTVQDKIKNVTKIIQQQENDLYEKQLEEEFKQENQTDSYIKQDNYNLNDSGSLQRTQEEEIEDEAIRRNKQFKNYQQSLSIQTPGQTSRNLNVLNDNYKQYAEFNNYSIQTPIQQKQSNNNNQNPYASNYSTLKSQKNNSQKVIQKKKPPRQLSAAGISNQSTKLMDNISTTSKFTPNNINYNHMSTFQSQESGIHKNPQIQSQFQEKKKKNLNPYSLPKFTYKGQRPQTSMNSIQFQKYRQLQASPYNQQPDTFFKSNSKEKKQKKSAQQLQQQTNPEQEEFINDQPMPLLYQQNQQQIQPQQQNFFNNNNNQLQNQQQLQVNQQQIQTLEDQFIYEDTQGEEQAERDDLKNQNNNFNDVYDQQEQNIMNQYLEEKNQQYPQFQNQQLQQQQQKDVKQNQKNKLRPKTSLNLQKKINLDFNNYLKDGDEDFID